MRSVPGARRHAPGEPDAEALGSDTMKTVFDRMRQLRGYVDANFSGRDWNLASAMVIGDKAAVQIMGDWAKGEFLNAGKKPGKDFMCFRVPGTQGMVTFNSDQFVMFKVGSEGEQAQMVNPLTLCSIYNLMNRSCWSSCSLLLAIMSARLFCIEICSQWLRISPL